MLEGSDVSVFVVGAELLDLLPGEIEIPDFLLDLGLLPLVSVGGLGLVRVLLVAPYFPCSNSIPWVEG